MLLFCHFHAHFFPGKLPQRLPAAAEMEDNDGTVLFKGSCYVNKFPDGSVKKSKVICTLCQTELKHHQNTLSLSCHLGAEHTGTQTKLKKSTTVLAEWVATDCKTVSIKNVSRLWDILRSACCDQSYKLIRCHREKWCHTYRTCKNQRKQLNWNSCECCRVNRGSLDISE